MNNANQTPQSVPTENLLEQYSREAKRLQRQATSKQRHTALPVLRRLITNNILMNISLVSLFKQQELIQRKHLFQLLAVETGYRSWAELKHKLENATETECNHYSMLLRGRGYPNLWFSEQSEAQEYVLNNGGELVVVGDQVVVVVE